MLFGNGEAKRRRRHRTTAAPIESAPTWERRDEAFTGEMGGLGK